MAANLTCMREIKVACCIQTDIGAFSSAPQWGRSLPKEHRERSSDMFSKMGRAGFALCIELHEFRKWISAHDPATTSCWNSRNPDLFSSYLRGSGSVTLYI